MSSIYDWSAMAAGNANADAIINWQEGQPPSSVNNSARAMMQRLRELLSDLGATLRAGGTANALTVTANCPFASYQDGIRICLRASAGNSGPVTLNVNAIGAKPVRAISETAGNEAGGNGAAGPMPDIAALAAGNLVAGGIYEFIYVTMPDGQGGWLLLNPTRQAVPVGAVLALAGRAPPPGFLHCNGQAVSRSQYARLFHAIGTTYGGGDHATSFNLPDLRGLFVRGWDDGRGVDSGRAFGTVQTSQNMGHSHGFAATTSEDGGHDHARNPENTAEMVALWQTANLDGAFRGGAIYTRAISRTGMAGQHRHGVSGETAPQGGHEARPVNLPLYHVIRC